MFSWHQNTPPIVAWLTVPELRGVPCSLQRLRRHRQRHRHRPRVTRTLALRVGLFFVRKSSTNIAYGCIIIPVESVLLDDTPFTIIIASHFGDSTQWTYRSSIFLSSLHSDKVAASRWICLIHHVQPFRTCIPMRIKPAPLSPSSCLLCVNITLNKHKSACTQSRFSAPSSCQYVATRFSICRT
jgi:hypothetical protein